MGTMIDNKPDYLGEAKVWDCFFSNLPEDYIVYRNRETKGREFDYCILIPNKGLVVVEVKGWRSDEIVVHSPDNIELLGNHEFQKSPKKQARMYRFNLLNEFKELFNSSPLIMDMVCYPFIKYEDYHKLRLDIVSSNEYTLLLEDIENPEMLVAKIENVITSNLSIPHTSLSDELYTFIRKKYEPNYKEMLVDYTTYYSSIYYFNKSISDDKLIPIIENYFKGTKTILFVSNKKDIEYLSSKIVEQFKLRNIDYTNGEFKIGNNNIFEEQNTKFRIFNLEVYLLNKVYNDGLDFEIHDGNNHIHYSNILEQLQKDVGFNYQQFALEHATKSKNIMVKAGAGTGKTYSMVSRIAYLCLNNESPMLNLSDDLVMVTFTNDAAENMKSRLKNILLIILF